MNILKKIKNFFNKKEIPQTENTPICLACNFVHIGAKKRILCRHPRRRYSQVFKERSSNGSCKQKGLNFEKASSSS